MVDTQPLMVAVTSLNFGSYRVPLHHLHAMTCSLVVAEVGRLAGSAASAASAAASAAVQSPPPTYACASVTEQHLGSIELEQQLGQLHCADRLRADLPVLMRNQLSALLVRCWTYLLWMYAVVADAGPMDRIAREQLLWRLMRPFEASHSTEAECRHTANRHAKTSIKKGCRLIELLLCEYDLLSALLQLDNLSVDVVRSLPLNLLTPSNVRHLIQQAKRIASSSSGSGSGSGRRNGPGSVRVMRDNVRVLLASSSTQSEDAIEQLLKATRRPAGRAASRKTVEREMSSLMLHDSSSPSSSSSSTSPPSEAATATPAPVPHSAPPSPSATATFNSEAAAVAADSPMSRDGRSVTTEQRVDTSSTERGSAEQALGEQESWAEDAECDVDDVADEVAQPCSDEGETAVLRSADEQGAVSDDEQTSPLDQEPRQTVEHRARSQQGRGSSGRERVRVSMRRQSKEAASDDDDGESSAHEVDDVADEIEPQSISEYEAAEAVSGEEEDATMLDTGPHVAPPRSSTRSLLRDRSQRRSVRESSPPALKRKRRHVVSERATRLRVSATPAPLPPPPPRPTPPSQPSASAVARLSTVTFRAVDDVRGCVADDAVHDLFCLHHRAWRQRVLAELADFTLDDMAALRQHETDRCSPDLRPDQQYLQLTQQWGTRMQFVAPLQVAADVTMEEALSHLSLEPESHDSGRLFYSPDGVEQLLSQSSAGITSALASSSSSSSSSASRYDFVDPAVALGGAAGRKYWVFASDHARDAAGANSAHMLALYRLFDPGCGEASLDTHSGIVTRLPLGLFLRLGCMLVVVVQTEGSVVYVLSASGNESAHLVTTAADRAAVSVAGNILSPRHLARLIVQHEADGPSEASRLERAHDFGRKAMAASPSKAEAEQPVHTPDSQLDTPLPRPPVDGSMVSAIHAFLSGVGVHDPSYQPEYWRQSWIPDLFSSTRACQLLSDAIDHEQLPASMIVQHLLEMGRVDDAQTRAALSQLATRSVSSSKTERGPSWHACHARYGCIGQPAAGSAYQRVRDIRRAPILLSPAACDAAHADVQVRLARHVHQGVAGKGHVACNSFVPAPAVSQPAAAAAKKQRVAKQQREPMAGSVAGFGVSGYEYAQWKPQSNGDTALTARWMQDSLRQRGAVYLTDCTSRARDVETRSQWEQQADAMVRELVGDSVAGGFLLRHCLHHSAGVHSPSFFALFSTAAAHISSPHHNESHRVAAWHLLLRHSETGPLISAPVSRRPMAAASLPQPVRPPPSPRSSSRRTGLDRCRVTAAAVSVVYGSMALQSWLSGGNDHMLDEVTASSRRRVVSEPSDRYPNSVSLAFG